MGRHVVNQLMLERVDLRFELLFRQPAGQLREKRVYRIVIPKIRATSSCECLGAEAAHQLARVQMYFRLHPPKLIWFCLDQWGGLVHRSSPHRRATADEYQRPN